MNIVKDKNGGKLVVTVTGRLDTGTSPQLEEALALDGVTELVLDFTGLEYISSAGLRVLLSTEKIMNKQGCMTVRNINETVKEVFDITGFSDILNIQ